MPGADLQDRRGAIDAAVEQGRVTRRKMQRRDGNRLAETDVHRFEWPPLGSRRQGPSALSQFDFDRREEAELRQKCPLPFLANLIGDLRRPDVRAFLHDLGNRALPIIRVRIMNDVAVDVKLVGAIVDFSERFHDTGIHRHRDREWLEGRTHFIDPEGRAVEIGFGSGLPGNVRIERRQRSHRQHFTRVDIHDHACGADRRVGVHRRAQLMFERLLDLARDRQGNRVAARSGVGQLLVERAFGARRAVAVDIGKANDMRREAGLGVEAVGGALERQPGLAERVDCFDQLRRGTALEEEERLVRAQHREIGGFVMLGHQPGEGAGELELVADDLGRLERDRPHVDRTGEQMPVAVDDVAARWDEAGEATLAPGMIAERGQP